MNAFFHWFVVMQFLSALHTSPIMLSEKTLNEKG